MAPEPLRGPSFRLKLSVLAVAVAVVPVVAVGFVVGDVNRKALASGNQQLLDSVIENVATTATGALGDADRALTMVAAAIGAPPDARAAVVEAALDVGATVRQLGFYDESGALLTTVEATRGPAPPALPARLDGDLRAPGLTRTGRVVFEGGEAYLLRAVTTRDAPVRTVAAYAALRSISDRVIAVGLVHLPAGHVAVLTPDRVAIADSRAEGLGTAMDRASFGMLAGLDRGALPNRTIYSSGEYERTDGTAVVGALRSLEGTPFTVVVELPYAVVYHSIASVRRVVVVAVIVAIAIAIAAGVLLARRMTRPIAALVAFAHDLSQRRFDQRVTVRSYDELGLLGDALERAARDLQASEIQIREEQAIRGDLRRYLPAPLVDQIVERKRSLALGGERREISVLFADVVGFTPLAERQSAETVVALLNELFTILTEIVFRHGGTVDKFIGDCVMAVWGASELQPDHAERAVAAARDMQRWRQVGNEMWRERYGVEIELAIGVNSGEAIVGNFGSETRMEFTAIGDVVNVAARLEAIARPNQILATAATHSRVEDKRDWSSLGVRPIVGKAQPIELYEVRA